MDYFSAGLLVVLTVQRSGSSILLHDAGKIYSTALAVLLAEILKQIICFGVAMYQIRQEQNIRLPSHESSSKQRVAYALRDIKEASLTFASRVFSKNAWIVLIPAALFVVQNNLFLFASSRISPSTFQALWQLRLIPTAFFSQVLLKKQLGIRQWLALSVILAGVITIQQGSQNSGVIASAAAQKASLTAIGALALAAVFGSLAGVLLEKHFKEAGTNLWISNFLLSSFSLIPAALVVVLDVRKQDTASFASITAFATSFRPWSAVLIQGLAGILVALTIKYAGCIAGSISGIASIAVTHLIEVLSGSQSSSAKEISFLIGFILVAVGVVWYSIYGKVPVKGEEQPSHTSPADSTGAIHLEMTPTPTKEEMWTPLKQSDDDDNIEGKPLNEKFSSSASSKEELTSEKHHFSPFIVDYDDDDKAELSDDDETSKAASTQTPTHTHTLRNGQSGPVASTSPLL